MISVLVTLNPKGIENPDETRNMLEKIGLEVNTFYPFGLIHGELQNENQITQIRKLDSVKDISRDRIINLAPPNSEIQ